MDHNININVKVQRQRGPRERGHFETYILKDVSQNAFFLEIIDIFSEQLIAEDKEPVIYDHDCHEGICGICSIHVNRRSRDPISTITTCQLYVRTFKDSDTIIIEPWRPTGFPIICDLMVDRSTYDKVIQAGGYISVSTGGVPNANSIPIPKHKTDGAVGAASCISCGTCAAACKSESTMLSVSAKVSQLALLPQGRAEAHKRVKAMVAKVDGLGFGNCTNTRVCEMECPKNVSISHITHLNHRSLVTKLGD